ncbi:capsular polysaccharide export protein, LipB/KpsS family [Bacillus sp. SB49]|uniref:capsular polysaccharide export protein, LipB/KpsS family n=1 Tax=Bacillus sp. SB49 TaxID=1071080 RepID=UPI001F321671|nr:hypothetical protein [Bacillus sp. SB49]
MKDLTKAIVGDKGYAKLASSVHKIKPKQKTEKTVAFMIGFSLWKRDHVQSFYPEYQMIFVEEKQSVGKTLKQAKQYDDVVFIVWGYKEHQKMKSFAQNYGIPLYRMEDGFIRSVDLGAAHSIPLSMCLDSKALYYDSTEASDLEDILNNHPFSEDNELMDKARTTMKLLTNLEISKYNNVSKKNTEKIYGPKTQKRILVVGQVEDDASIAKGSARKMTNNDLVWLAKTENPDAQIIYKPHPDVLFGKRAMQSNPEDVAHIAQVIREPLSLNDAFKTIDHVYTITSLAGFEALIRGISVTTVGAPFYSGWGLTDDRQEVARRNRTLTIDEIFAAAYLLYPKYISPFTKEEISAEEAVRIIERMRSAIQDRAIQKKVTEPAAFFFGFDLTKADYANAYFSHDEKVFISADETLASLDERSAPYTDLEFIIWDGFSKIDEILELAAEKKIQVKVVKTGPINMGGGRLGNDLSFSLYVHEADGSLKSTDEAIIQSMYNYDFASRPELKAKAQEAMKLIKKYGISEYNLSSQEHVYEMSETDSGRRVLLLGDKKQTSNTSVKDMAWIAKMENPEAELLYIPHPLYLLEGKKDPEVEDIEHFVRIIDQPVTLAQVIGGVDHVYTQGALGGMEALLYGKQVTTFGEPFYAGWGLTDDRSKTLFRHRTLLLEELFIGSYMLCTSYYHPFTKEKISLKEAIEMIGFMKTALKGVKDKWINKERTTNLPTNSMTSSKENQPLSLEELEVKGEENGDIGILSKGIKDIPNLQSFLNGTVNFSPAKSINSLSFIAGWGMKPSAEKAIAFGEKHNIPYLRLEDGFLRSVGLGVNNYPPLSMCVDDVGIYYDGTRPSRLENILNTPGWETEELMDQACEAKRLIVENQLSKYNHAPPMDKSLIKDYSKTRVLLIDQTLGDKSVGLGMADESRFEEMYHSAREDHPEADIYIKTHPDVIAGKKQGYFSNVEIDEHTYFIYDDCNPLTLLEQFSEVYVVTSQMGFEALMLGKRVHCFGLPFYSNWGITVDRLQCPRRQVTRTVEEVFAAAYLMYPRYINPETGRRGTIFEVIEHIKESRTEPVN